MAPRARPPSPVHDLIPAHADLERLRAAAAGCRACGLWRDATQTVFGEGASDADVMLVGEQPGAAEVHACRPWLDAELAVVRPRALVCLGATAAQALLGPDFRVTRQRGELLDSDLARYVLATVHPSSILRAPDDEARDLAYKGFVADLATVARAIGP